MRSRRSAPSAANFRLELLPQLLDHLAHDLSRDVLGLVGDQASRRHQRGDQIDVLFQIGQRFGLEQKLRQPLSLDRVFLDERHDVVAKELAEAGEPFRDVRGRAAKASAALLAVNKRQRLVHLRHPRRVAEETGRGCAESTQSEGRMHLFRFGSKRQTPPQQRCAIDVGQLGCAAHSKSSSSSIVFERVAGD